MYNVTIQPNTFNKIEAIELMMNGEKMSHISFTDKEWVRINGGGFQFEDGYKCSPEEFWRYRNTINWLINWSIFK